MVTTRFELPKLFVFKINPSTVKVSIKNSPKKFFYDIIAEKFFGDDEVEKNFYRVVDDNFFLILSDEKIFVTAEVEGNEKIITKVDAKKNLLLEINFIHSVQKTPVIEELKFDGEKFILLRTKYQSHGVGLPFMESDGNFRAEGNFFVMDDMNREIKNLSLRTGIGTELTIKIDGEEIKLYEKFPVGTKINFEVTSTLKKFLNSTIGRKF